ncbi:hypothetical protein DFP72DRAFT_1009846 [Ephemerocybe angulata]|uniref:Uncharacterized protein n=1 Tax=Ephemerocybe angulata TaxID=980116 RepID=A0A8H6M5X8_9AGAR|nr:hypothetical protein DFP72DRAFT_1009846 [Tulosesus angulatus]
MLLNFSPQSLLKMGVFAAFMTFVVLALAKRFGYSVTIGRISFFPFTIHDICYKYCSPKRFTTGLVRRTIIRFHIPTPSYPRITSIEVEGCSFVQGDAHAASVDHVVISVWFLPVFFRHTAGPIMTVKIEGFVADTINSKGEPWWVRDMRRNVTETLLQGETIRLHDLKTRIWLYKPITPPEDAHRLDIEGADFDTTVDEDEDEDDEGEVRVGHDELDDTAIKAREVADESEARIRVHGEHWLIRNPNNDRTYTFGEVNVELRRPWGAAPYDADPNLPTVEKKLEAPPGALVVSAKSSMWTKLPRPYTDERYLKASTPMQLFLSLIYFPHYVVRLVTDPLSVVDLDVSDAELTFREFRLRDAELLRQSAKAAKQEYQAISPASRQVISDFTWEIFCDAVELALTD